MTSKNGPTICPECKEEALIKIIFKCPRCSILLFHFHCFAKHVWRGVGCPNFNNVNVSKSKGE